MARQHNRAEWVEAARHLSLEAQEIAANAPLEEVGPRIIELAYAGRLHPPEDSDDDDDWDIVDRLFARARELDPEAWAERGVNPDLLGQRPQSEAERRMQDCRSHSIGLASDELLCADRPDITEALRSLEQKTEH